jgi:SAM-dependent methyltransferase
VFYRAKDYGAECDILDQFFREFGPTEIRSLLDAGCGTGKHAVLLARRGYSVTGVDQSEAMLDVARERARAAGVDVTFVQGDLSTIDFPKQFDAAIMMFAVIGYFSEKADLLRMLRNLRKHLVGGAVLIFDFWYGPAVLAIRPEKREQRFGDSGDAVIRKVETELDVERSVCRVSYVVREEGLAESQIVQEVHTMRFFFSEEIRAILRDSGFALCELRAFPSTSEIANQKSWNAIAIATAIPGG